MPTNQAKITSFDTRLARVIIDECRDALAPIAEKYGLTLDRKGSNYRPDALPVMLQFLIKEVDSSGVTVDARGKDFKRYAMAFGLKPSDLGREFSTFQGTYRICGLKPRSDKYPVLAEDVRTGKTYKFPPEVVKASLAKGAA